LAHEDDILYGGVAKSGPHNWACIAAELPGRSAKQCRERWHNHMNSGLKKVNIFIYHLFLSTCFTSESFICQGHWSQDEDKVIIQFQENLGNQWSKVK
jgi:hypothetical protein